MQRETIIEQNEKRKGQLNLMLFETRGKIADHNAGRSILDDEVSTGQSATLFSTRCVAFWRDLCLIHVCSPCTRVGEGKVRQAS